MDRSRARAALERDFSRLREAPTVRPPRGWVRAIRDALGMSVRELAERLELSPSRVPQIEQGEVSGTITLSTLERAAAALGCRVEYVLVPEQPLEQLVVDQARLKAEAATAEVDHMMALRAQGTDSGALHRQRDELARRLIDRRGLWS